MLSCLDAEDGVALALTSVLFRLDVSLLYTMEDADDRARSRRRFIAGNLLW